MLDFIRIACAVPAVKVGDVEKNTADICAYMEKADAANADLVVFPELALTGYSCGDLFFQSALLREALSGLKEICSFSENVSSAVAVGMPLSLKGRLYNCGVVICDGEITAWAFSAGTVMTPMRT